MLNKLSLIITIIGICTISLIQYFLISGSYNAGYDACQSQYREEILKEQYKNQQKEIELNSSISNLNAQLAETRTKYENTVKSLKSSYTDELFKSKQRAELYKRLSEEDRVKQRALAEHAAKLDRSLTEGRELVKQLTETIRVRDSQLKALGIYIQESMKMYE